MASRSNQAGRRPVKKAGLELDESRRKREEFAVEIRRKKKEQNLQKKRNIEPTAVEDDPNMPRKVHDQLRQIPVWTQMIWSNDPQHQIEAAKSFRQILSIESSPPIKEVIDAGVVPRFVELLTAENNSVLQFEAAWALTNIASGSSNETLEVIKAGAVPHFIQLLSSPDSEVREQAIWALGNIAGDSVRCRDYVLNCGALGPLIEQLNRADFTCSSSMLKNATWTLSNFCRGKPQPLLTDIAPALTVLASLLFRDVDDEVLTDACWALSYISDGPNERIDAVLQTGVEAKLVHLLMHSKYSVQTPALRTIGNIVTGDDIQTQAVLNRHVLPCLLQLLSSPKKGIRKEACWTISNITAGNKEQIQHVIDANLIPPLIHLLRSADWDIRKEAAWAISNATSGGTPEQIKYLVDQGAIKPLCDMLAVLDSRIIVVALEALDNILRVGHETEMGGVNQYAEFVEAAGGLEKIYGLTRHQKEDVYDKCFKIIDTYFQTAEDNMAAPANATTFSFGDVPNPGGQGFFLQQ